MLVRKTQNAPFTQAVSTVRSVDGSSCMLRVTQQPFRACAVLPCAGPRQSRMPEPENPTAKLGGQDVPKQAAAVQCRRRCNMSSCAGVARDTKLQMTFARMPQTICHRLLLLPQGRLPNLGMLHDSMIVFLGLRSSEKEWQWLSKLNQLCQCAEHLYQCRHSTLSSSL